MSKTCLTCKHYRSLQYGIGDSPRQEDICVSPKIPRKGVMVLLLLDACTDSYEASEGEKEPGREEVQKTIHEMEIGSLVSGSGTSLQVFGIFEESWSPWLGPAASVDVVGRHADVYCPGTGLRRNTIGGFTIQDIDVTNKRITLLGHGPDLDMIIKGDKLRIRGLWL